MAEHKWTPGPWTVDGPPWSQIVWSSADNRVCFLSHTNGLDDDRDIATGRLIAAAPDLADALATMLERYVSLVNCGDCGNWDPETEDEVKSARAALSRAGA